MKAKLIRTQRAISTKPVMQTPIDDTELLLEKGKSQNSSFDQQVQLPQLSTKGAVKVLNFNETKTKNLEMYKEKRKKVIPYTNFKKTSVNVNIQLPDKQIEMNNYQIDLKIRQTNQNKFQLKLWLNNEEGGFAPNYQPNKLKQAEARALTPLKKLQNGQGDADQQSSPHQKLEPLRTTKINLNKQGSEDQPTTIQMSPYQEDQSLEITQQPSDEFNINLDIFLSVEQKLSDILKHIKPNNHIELVDACNNYMETVILDEFDQVEAFFKDEKHKKLVRQSLLMERMGLVVLVNSFFEGHFFMANLANFKNTFIYTHQNYFILCDLVAEQLKKSMEENKDNQPLQDKLQKLQVTVKLVSSKTSNHHKRNHKGELMVLLRQNIEMLQNLYKQLTKNCRDLYQFILNFFRVANQVPLRQGFRSMLEFSALYFTVQQSYQGLVGVHLLTVSPEPYLLAPPTKPFTLVLDMDETLVHFTETPQGGQFLVRPFALQFLNEMHEFYELVVFTAGLPDYANWVLNSIDPNGLIKYRLFRQHATHQRNVFIKDLSRIGRPLSKSIIVDNVAENFQNQPENGIFIKPWYNDPNDTALAELAPLLKQIVIKQYDDVRVALKHFKEQMIQNMQQGQHSPHLNLQLK